MNMNVGNITAEAEVTIHLRRSECEAAGITLEDAVRSVVKANPGLTPTQVDADTVLIYDSQEKK